LPEFIVVIALARLAGMALRARKLPVLRTLLVVKLALLISFFALAVGYGPFPDANTPAALLTGFSGIAAMAVQNALQRVHLSALPPTTLMTGSTTQATLDAVDLITGVEAAQRGAIRARFGRLSLTILYFAAGCAASALLYAWIGFQCLGMAVLVGIAAALMRIEQPSS
jgi:uncharacterized membrane protein YoaK (UPF0700 family)